MILHDPDAEPPVRVVPSEVSALAFALDEFFDVLDVLYLERDGAAPSVPRNDCLRGFTGFDRIAYSAAYFASTPPREECCLH
jgi:hypothetical protein